MHSVLLELTGAEYDLTSLKSFSHLLDMYTFLVGIYECRSRESYHMKKSQYRLILSSDFTESEQLLMAFPHIPGVFLQDVE